MLGDADAEILGDADGLDSSKSLLPSSFNNTSPSSLLSASGSIGAEMTYPIVAFESSAIVKSTAGIVSPAVVSRFLIPIVALTDPVSVVLTSVQPLGAAVTGSPSTPRKTTTLPSLFTHCHVGVLASVVPVMSSCPPTPDESIGFVLSNSPAGTLITLADHSSPELAVTVKLPETYEPDPIQ